MVVTAHEAQDDKLKLELHLPDFIFPFWQMNLLRPGASERTAEVNHAFQWQTQVHLV